MATKKKAAKSTNKKAGKSSSKAKGSKGKKKSKASMAMTGTPITVGGDG